MSDTTITLKLQAPVIERLQAIAALAGVTFDQAAAVILAVEVCGSPFVGTTEAVPKGEKPQQRRNSRTVTLTKEVLTLKAMSMPHGTPQINVAEAVLVRSHGFTKGQPFGYKYNDDETITFTQEIK